MSVNVVNQNHFIALQRSIESLQKGSENPCYSKFERDLAAKDAQFLREIKCMLQLAKYHPRLFE